MADNFDQAKEMWEPQIKSEPAVLVVKNPNEVIGDCRLCGGVILQGKGGVYIHKVPVACDDCNVGVWQMVMKQYAKEAHGREVDFSDLQAPKGGE